MNLFFDKQYPVYAFDTACFYTDEEYAEEKKLQEARFVLAKSKKPKNDGDKITQEEKSDLIKASGAAKKRLKDLIDSNVSLVRQVRPEAIKDSNLVQVFESSLTRNLNMTPNEINDAMVIVKVYFFGVAESIIKNGFDMNGKHYVFFSASAGQIRTKKFVAIREDLYKACEMSLTCGLSIDDINKAGGININKYLAYLALSNSATEEWKGFDINRCIVVDDFETVIDSVVDYIDEKDYSIKRIKTGVPITHTDGCGMILPSLSKKNFMVRAPWVKGLLASFPFDRFIAEANLRNPSVNHGIIKDVYGEEHDVMKENIQIIFCKSQFKLWKFYKNWGEYKKFFKKYHCTANKCNIEPSYIGRATINYQMLQTLTSITEDELEVLCKATNESLERISTDKDAMLRIFGAVPSNERPNPLQSCLMLYPELLRDEGMRTNLRDMKQSMEKWGRAGKLMIDGKYQFLIPDLYAACQYWFEGIEQPDGLLKNGEVASRVYGDVKKLDVLRSPHLYKEHAVRNNVWGDAPSLHRWFDTNGIYTSSWDTISKILQFDNDGDKALVVAEQTLVNVAERECVDVVPLYYPMAKAGAVEITPKALYDGMVAAWTGGNIGVISNQISKIWATDKPDLDAIKILCMENNFVIDYAKTLYKPTRPVEWDERLKKLDSGKLPSFFMMAKNKTKEQTVKRGNGTVDRLYKHIPTHRFSFNKDAVGEFDYRYLMYDKDIEYGKKEDDIVRLFRLKTRTLGTRKDSSLYDDDNVYWLTIKALRKEMLTHGSRQYIVDVLTKGLFDKYKSAKKSAFWDCFGDVLYENLHNNMPKGMKSCADCGSRFVVTHGLEKYCPCCRERRETQPTRTVVCPVCHTKFVTREVGDGIVCASCKAMSDFYKGKIKTTICCDCGQVFLTQTKGRPSVRCHDCQSFRNKYNRHKKD